MNNTFARALTRALPRVGRQCQPRVSPFRQTLAQARVFSFTPKTFQEPPQNNSPGLEQDLFGDQTDGLAKNKPPVSAIPNQSRGSVSQDYSRMAEAAEFNALNRTMGDETPAHHLHVYCHRRNTILTLTRPNGSPLMSVGTGVLGFRKARRGGYDPGFQLSAHVFGQIQERGLLLEIKALQIVFRGYSQGRTAFVKALMGNEGKNIRGLVTQVSDSTRMKFGGTRSSRVRRL